MLKAYCDSQSERLLEEDVEGRDKFKSIQSVYEASCQMVRQECEDAAEFDPVEAGIWLEKATSVWQEKQQQVREYFVPLFLGKTPLDVMDLIDSLSLV